MWYWHTGFIVLFFLFSFSGCQYNKQATVIPPDQEVAAYHAAIDTFLADSQVQQVLRTPTVEHQVLYIRPTFTDTGDSIPPAVMDRIAVHPSLQSFARVSSEQSGGIIITTSAFGYDPNVTLVYNEPGPTIQLSIAVSESDCGSGISIGYRVTTTNETWHLNQYLTGEC